MSNKSHLYKPDLSVIRAKIYRNGVWRLVRQSLDKLPQDCLRGNRQQISELSRSSLSRLTFTAQATSTEFLSMLTLTYSGEYPRNGKVVKAHLNNMLTWMRQRLGKFSYLWFMEFQRRGAPHFHIMLSLPEPYNGRRRMVAREWAKIVSRETMDETILGKVYRVHSHPGQWQAIRSKDGARRYVTKYALKIEQKRVPEEYQDCGRFWGCSRDVRPRPIDSFAVTEDGVRQYMDRYDHRMKNVEVLPKFLFGMID